MTHRVVGREFSRRFVYWNLLAMRRDVSRPVRCRSVLVSIEIRWADAGRRMDPRRVHKGAYAPRPCYLTVLYADY